MRFTAVLLSLAVAPLGPVSKQNSTAERVAALSHELGIHFFRDDSRTPTPSAGSETGGGRVALAEWLNTDTERGDDSISALPPAASDYLRDHRKVIDQIVTALEKQSPDWGPEPKEATDSSAPMGRLLPTITLGKVLLATALSDERNGWEFESERALEASASLARSLPRNTLIGQLLAVSFERWQAGVLRKKKTPSLVWMGRLTSGDPYQAMIDVADGERWTDPSGLPDRYSDAVLKGWKAMFEAIRRMSPCELSHMSNADIQKMSSAALEYLSFEDRKIAEILSGIAMPNLISAVRRAGRLLVDRELTLQILRLRLAREGSKDGRWPAELTDRWSDVCPGVAYVYRTDGISLDVHLDAWVDAGTEQRALPLSFHSGETRLLPTPTRPPTPTPTPTPEGETEEDEP